MDLNDVPMFPLDMVLFPQMVLRLQIFEPRYLLMVNECLKNDSPFGVVLLKEGPSVVETAIPDAPGRPVPNQVGTLAKIVEVLKLEDGRMLITTVGTERFHLLHYRTEKPYMTGSIKLWPEEASIDTPAVLEGLVAQVSAVFEAYLRVLMELAGKEIEGLEIPAEPTLLSYLIPNWMHQVASPDKQHLLEISNTGERLREEIQILERETDFLRRIKERADLFGITANEEETDPTTELNDTTGYNLGGRFSKN